MNVINFLFGAKRSVTGPKSARTSGFYIKIFKTVKRVKMLMPVINDLKSRKRIDRVNTLII